MANSKRCSYAAWLLLMLGFMIMVSTPEAYVFYAGGRDSWIVDPTESYNHWAERNRFQVNDTIVFMYDEAGDSVLLVTEPDFDACNTRNPVSRHGGGRTVFRFDRSGPYFFISADEDKCQKGQKLYIIVMAVRPTSSKPAVMPGVQVRPAALPPSAGATATARPPLSASAPEHARAPGMGVWGAPGPGDEGMSRSRWAPPPTSRAAGLDLDGVILGGAVAVLSSYVVFGTMVS